MSPTNLGDLPSNQPAPMGRIQRKWGNVDGNITWNNTVPSGTPMQDNTGGWISIDVTPTRRGWWLIHAQTMWHQAEDYWMSWEWGVSLQHGVQKTDLDGRQLHRTQVSRHAACGWTWSQVDCVYRLEAGLSYSATMVWVYSSGWNQHYNTRWDRHYIEGEFIGEGAA